jgi:hypothetical protein
MGFHQELSNINYCNSTRVLFYQKIYIFRQSVQVHGYIYFFLVDKIKTNIYPYFNMNHVCKRRV